MRTLLVTTALLAGCSFDRTSEVPAVQPHGSVTRTYLDGAAPKVDVLFVIDSSAAMTPYEAQVRQTLQAVAQTAENRLRGPRANLHVGVLTADLADAGAMRHASMVDGAYMIDRYTPSVDMRNYEGDFADTMLALTDVGTAGSSNVQPLAALEHALGDPQNAGFLRDDAKLAIVILAAEDDASAGDPADYRAFVQGLKAEADDAMIAVAAPDSATRLAAFAAGKIAPLTGEGVVDFVFQNACVPDASGEGWPWTCFDDDLLDSDPSQPGVQPTCTASDDGGSYPACGDGVATPCWRFTTNPSTCSVGLQFTIDRGAIDPPTLTNTVTVECVTR